MADQSLAQETVEAALAELDERSDAILRAAHPDGNPRWLTPVDDEAYRWLTPAEGRDHVQPRDGTASTLRHYDALEVVSHDDAPAAVRRAVGGWFGMAGSDDTAAGEGS